MDADTWLALAHGEAKWADAMQTGKINASGARSDLSEYLPLSANRISS
jgi:putative sterol carrier protein